MSLPGTTVELLDTEQPRSAPTDTGISFKAGFAGKGPLGPVLVTSMARKLSVLGDRSGGVTLHDAIDVFFHEQGGSVYVSRVVGPDALLSTLDLLDGDSAVSLTANAKSYGDWGDALKVEVVAGDADDTFVVIVTLDDVEVERSGDLADQDAAVAWSANSKYVDLVAGVSTNNPDVAAAAALTDGTDDRDNATDDDWLAAISLFDRELGPGQVSMPGRTTGDAHTNLLAHAAANNRRALLDYADTGDAATLLTAIGDDRDENARFGATFGPWAKGPGVVAGTTRTVPYSAVEAGIIARNDGLGLDPNVPSAGLTNGRSFWATDLSQTFSDEDREALNDAGFNVAVRKRGAICTFGYRSLANPDTEQNYQLFSNMRLIMAITAEADEIAENYLFQDIDGQGHLFSDLQGDLVGMLTPYWEAGALYGASAGAAFAVDVGNQVNTPETIQALEIHAVLDLRMSPFGERVVISIVKKGVTESVA